MLSWGGTLLGMVNGLRRHPPRDLHGGRVILESLQVAGMLGRTA